MRRFNYVIDIIMSDDERKFLFSLIIHNFAKNNRTLIAVCIDDDAEILNLKFLISDRNDVESIT